MELRRHARTGDSRAHCLSAMQSSLAVKRGEIVGVGAIEYPRRKPSSPRSSCRSEAVFRTDTPLPRSTHLLQHESE